VDVGAEAHVVSEVITIVIGIFIDHDVVRIPKPVAGVGDVGIGNREIEVIEAEAGWAPASQSPDVAGAEAAGEVAMFPGMVEVEADVGATSVVTYPLVLVDVGRFRMSLSISKMLFLTGCRGVMDSRRSVAWRFARREAVRGLGRVLIVALFLRRQQQERGEEYQGEFHSHDDRTRNGSSTDSKGPQGEVVD